jgi:hypothetical protein
MGADGNNSGLARAFGAIVLVIAMQFMAGCGEFFARDDFTGYVMNKTEKEVVAKVGKPATVDDSSPQRVVWTYKSITYDLQDHNKKDAKTLVIFRRDAPGAPLRVAEVKFEH